MIDGYCITQCHGFSNKEDCTSAGFRVINGNNALYKNYCEWSEKNVACKPECWQLSQGTTMEPDYEAMCREVGCLWEYGHSPESRTSRCVETSAPEKL